jgi:hypothetical protein
MIMRGSTDAFSENHIAEELIQKVRVWARPLLLFLTLFGWLPRTQARGQNWRDGKVHRPLVMFTHMDSIANGKKDAGQVQRFCTKTVNDWKVAELGPVFLNLDVGPEKDFDKRCGAIEEIRRWMPNVQTGPIKAGWNAAQSALVKAQNAIMVKWLPELVRLADKDHRVGTVLHCHCRVPLLTLFGSQEVTEQIETLEARRKEMDPEKMRERIHDYIGEAFK